MPSTTNESELYLTQPTPEEIRQQLRDNSEEWKGPLTIEAYYERENFLLDQDLTRDGGLTPWVLCKGRGESRQALSSCESIRKRALVVKDGRVEQVTCHGVASVFCPKDMRGKGYAGTMIKLLGERLQHHQHTDSSKILFSVLYSDIGKKFYAARGWIPFPSAHISLHPTTSQSTVPSLPATSPLHAADLPELCKLDEQLLHSRLNHASATRKNVVAIIPDIQTITWAQARETFVADQLYPGDKKLDIKGAIVSTESGKRVWCYWTRVWSSSDLSNVDKNEFHILRLVVEDPNYLDFEAATEVGLSEAADSEIVKAIAAVLNAAREEAGRWDMGHVELWNPTSATLAAARLLEKGAGVTHREDESIASLRWYGEDPEHALDHVEWLSNEKYAWC